MFDSYSSSSSSARANASVTMTGIGAAGAARLYGELRAQAERDVAGAYLMRIGPTNTLTVLSIAAEHDMESHQVKTRFQFTINGRLFDITNALPLHTLRDAGHAAFAEAVGQLMTRQLFKLLREVPV